MAMHQMGNKDIAANCVRGKVVKILFSDFWKAYQAVIPEEQLTQVGKETGETAHVERWNCTLRQRLGRFVRETFSFSKIMPMHILCLDLFLHRYNLDRAILLD